MVCKAKVYGAAQHPPEVIAQDENNRFVSDAQIQQWTEGTAGQGQFMSMVFMRSATVPATPEGGHWGFTIPDGGLWTNTILPGIDPVFVSTRFFTSDGALPQEAVWRPPVLFVRNGDSGSKGETGNPGTPGIQGPPGIGINGADGVNGKDGTSVVWLGEAMAHPINPEDGFSYRNTADRKSYIYWDGAWYQMTVDGFDGLSGYSNAIVTLYRASLSTTEEPASFSGTFTYDFSTGILSGGTLNGWSQNIPAIEINEVIWARQASAAGNETTDTIEAGEFSGGVVITGSGTNGLNSATVMLFHKNTSATIPPAMPTGTFSYSFLTHVLSGGTLNGWTQSAPNVSATEFLWLIQATASATSNTDGIEHTEFSAPVVIAASGNNGLDIVWKGNLATPPANPVKNWVYRDTDNHIVYIYNGSAWELMVLDGSDGIDGANGTDGLSVFITYHDADPQGPPPAPPTNVAGTNNGWHTNPTANVGWMSQKVDDGTGIGWGLAIPIRGANGNSGPRGSNTFTIDEADANTPNITPTVAANWAGTLTNADAQAVVIDIMSYFAHDGFLRSNDKITITDKNNQIAGTRVYIGVATNNFTQILASHFSSLIEEVMHGSLLIHGTVAAEAFAADIIAGGQLIGGQLVIGYNGIGGDKPPPNADSTIAAINAFTEVNSGGLKMTNTPDGNYVQMTPGSFAFVRNGSPAPIFEFNGTAAIMRDANGTVLLQSGGNLDYARVGGSKPPSDADRTAVNTAAGIVNQGSLATKNSVDYGSEVGGVKPPSNADNTGSNTSYNTDRVGGDVASQVVRAGNKITSSNIGTYINSLAVTNGYIDNLAVNDAKIATAAVGTLKLGANAATVAAFFDVGGHTISAASWVTVAGSAAINLASGVGDMQVLVISTVRINHTYIGSDNQDSWTACNIRLLRTGPTGTAYSHTLNSSGVRDDLDHPITFIDTISSAGWHHYQIQVYRTAFVGVSPNQIYPVLSAAGSNISAFGRLR